MGRESAAAGLRGEAVNGHSATVEECRARRAPQKRIQGEVLALRVACSGPVACGAAAPTQQRQRGYGGGGGGCCGSGSGRGEDRQLPTNDTLVGPMA